MATVKELEAQIAKLEASNAALLQAVPAPREITLKISDKTGCIVMSGIAGRFPISLYRSSWARMYSQPIAKLVLDFMKEYDEEITATMKAAGKTDH
jgi:hypothetical protein